MEPTHISKDDLEALEFMMEQFQKAQYALEVFKGHISQKYLKQGDTVKANGEIVRATPQPPTDIGKEAIKAVADDLKNNGQLRQAVREELRL